MAANFTISAIIKAVDKVSAPMAAMRARIQTLTAPIKKLGGSLYKLGDASGLLQVGRAMGRLGSAAQDAGNKIKGVLGPLIAIGSAAIAGGLYAVTKGFSDVGDEADATARKLGVTTQELQEMRFAASKLDVEQGALDGGLKKLARSITMASKGAKDQVRAFKLLGYTDKQIAGGKISVSDATVRLTKRYDDEKKAKSNNIIANALLGKSYLELTPLLRGGSKNLAEQIALAHKYGYVMSDEAIKAATEFDDAQKDLGASINGVRNVIGAKLLPIITPLLISLTEWAVKNREIIATKVTEFVAKLSKVIDGIDWNEVAAGVSAFSKALIWVAENLGLLLQAWIALKIFSIISSVALLVLAFKGLGVAILTTPFGIIATAIALIVVGLVGLFSHWEQFVGWLKRIDVVIEETTAAWAASFKANFIDPVVAFFDMIVGRIDRFVGRIADAASAVKNLATDNAITRGFNNVFGDSPPTAGSTGATLAGQAIGGGGANNAQANVQVEFKNAPAGTRVRSEVQGKGMNLGTDVGYQTGGAF